MSKPYAIVTCSDAKYGGFLLNHWLESLLQNVNLEQIDVVVLDYGLNQEQRNQLLARQVVLIPCRKDGSSVVLLRFRDIVTLFQDRGYEKVLSVDGGDVIYQTEISDVFSEPCDRPALAAEEILTPFVEFMKRDDIHPELLPEILGYVRNKLILNSGVVLGTAQVFQKFWTECRRVCRSFTCHGTDQLIMNYLAYRDGFHSLSRNYNFVIVAAKTPFRIRQGVFYFRDGSRIPVVHDAGGSEWVRVISNFGYGRDRNRRKLVRPLLHQVGMNAVAIWRKLKSNGDQRRAG